MNSNTVLDNIYENLYIANVADGLNRSLITLDRGLEYICNLNDNPGYDFVARKLNETVGDGIKLNQGGNNEPAKNTFSQDEGPIGSDFTNLSDQNIMYWYYNEISTHRPLDYYTTLNFIPMAVSITGPECETAGILQILPFISIDSLNDLYIYYTEIYDSLTQTRDSIVDGGNSSYWVNRVNTTNSGQKASLIASLNLISPNTSEDLIAAVINRDDLFTSNEINSFLLNNRHFYLYPNVQEDLVELWSYEEEEMLEILTGASPSSFMTLETNLSRTMRNRSLSYSYIMHLLSIDSKGVNIDTLQTLYQEFKDIEHRYNISDLKLSQTEFSEAVDVLEDIPVEYTLNSRMDTIHDQYLAWFDIADDINNAQDTLIDWIFANEADLIELANATITKPAARARSLLYLADSSYDYYWHPQPFEEILEPRTLQDFHSGNRTDPIIEVSPNPIIDELHFKYKVKGEESVTWILYDYSGTILKTIKLSPEINHTLTVTDLPSGFYIFTIIQSGRTKGIGKFVK